NRRSSLIDRRLAWHIVRFHIMLPVLHARPIPRRIHARHRHATVMRVLHARHLHVFHAHAHVFHRPKRTGAALGNLSFHSRPRSNRPTGVSTAIDRLGKDGIRPVFGWFDDHIVGFGHSHTN